MAILGRVPTRLLLQLAAFGAVSALIILALTPFNTAIALLNPLLYAVTASLTLLIPFTARIWSMTPGAATGCAALAGVLVAPFSALGFLLPLALAIPALCFDLVLFKCARPRPARLTLAAGTAAVAIWALSLAVIEPTLLSPAFLVALIVIRIFSFLGMVLIARGLAARLAKVGVQPVAPREHAPTRGRRRVRKHRSARARMTPPSSR